MTASSPDRAPLDFLAIMSHEIRTPLQSIFGALELMEQEELPESAHALVGLARHSSVQLLQLLDDILDFTKCDINRMELDQFEVPVRLLAHGVIEAMALRVGSKPVTLQVDIADDVPRVIMGDPKRLRQILINLIGNAIKFTAHGSVTLQIRRQDSHLHVEVIDTGIGITPDVQKRLFEPFVQADASTARLYGGSGLGLSIARKMVELMQGSMGVISTPGAGSRFWFSIPFQEIASDMETEINVDLTGCRILVVDDHPRARAEMEGTLHRLGATVDVADSVTAARDQLGRSRYDAAIIDQGLPDGKGMDLIRWMRDGALQTVCILYTVHNAPDLHFALNSMGGRYLAKPASRAGLARALDELLINRRGDSPALRVQHKILIVEDTESVRAILARQMRAIGVDHDFARNGREALSLLEQTEYALVITDFHMPDMDGGALVHAINGRLPVIVLTADVDLMNPVRVRDLGFSDHLIKPVSLGHLRRVLARWGAATRPNDNGPLSSVIASPPQKNGWQQLSPFIDLDLLTENMGTLSADLLPLLHAFGAMNKDTIDHFPTEPHLAAEAAHALQGAALSIGFVSLAEQARALEKTAREGQYDHALTRALRDNFEGFVRLVESLEVTAFERKGE